MNTRNSIFRLSRISHPRATIGAMLLLALVFLFFGLVAEAYVPNTTSTGGGFSDWEVIDSVINMAWPMYD